MLYFMYYKIRTGLKQKKTIQFGWFVDPQGL